MTMTMTMATIIRPGLVTGNVEGLQPVDGIGVQLRLATGEHESG